MQKICCLIVFISAMVFSVHSQDKPPRPFAPQKDPIKILQEIQSKMEEIEKDLSKGSIDREKSIKNDLQKAMQKTGKTREEQRKLAEQLAKILSEKKPEQGKIAEEIEEMLTKNRIDKLIEKLEVWQINTPIDQQAEIDRLFQELMQAKNKQEEAIKQLQELMKHCGLKQEEVDEQLQKLANSLNSEKKVEKMIEQLMQSVKKQEKAMNDMEQLFNELGRKQKKVLKDIDVLMEMAQKIPSHQPQSKKKKQEKKDKKQEKKEKKEKKEGEEEKDKEKENDPDNRRWGNLPPKVREYIHASRELNMPVKYRRYIEEYYKTILKEDEEKTKTEEIKSEETEKDE